MSHRKIVFALFFLSGFCGLLYQVVWMRLAFAHFGIITPVLSVVVSVFMLGLALGSWAAGALISRLAARRFSAIYLYAAVELLIGVGAVVVPKLYGIGDSILLPSGGMNSFSYLFLSALVLSATLLPWCVLMGTTFPLMMAFLRERPATTALAGPPGRSGGEGSGTSSFSYLYLANVIGAMCGTILTADVLVELLGFRRTLWVAGLSNAIIAAGSIALGLIYPYVSRSDDAVPAVEKPTMAGGRWRTYCILFVTGFTSMSMEVIWVRDFTSVLGTTIYAFATIVAVYLLATWTGSTTYRRHEAAGNVYPLTTQMAALAVFALFPILVNDPRLNLRQTGVILGIFPFSFLLGYLTPGLIDHYSHGDPDRAGRAYAVNIAGCILGPLAASYLFLPYIGVKDSMILMALPYAAFFAMNREHVALAVKSWALPSTIALLVGAAFMNHSYEERYDNGIIRRDSTATVISVGSGMGKRLLVNGVGITELTTITKVMAHFPLAILKEKPTSALDICFGMGTTYRSLLTWDGLKVTAVELVPSVPDALGYYHADAAQVLANPNGQVVIDDGRRFLRRTNEMFDLVTIDPPPPVEAAGSSLLYTEEFYAQMKKRMKPAAILQQWFPGGAGVEFNAIARSLMASFPYIRAYGSTKGWGTHFYCSMQPISIPSAAVAASRLPQAAKIDLLEWEPGSSPTEIFQGMLSREVHLPQVVPEGVAITDDQPYNEYYFLRRSWAHNRKILEGGFQWLTSRFKH